MHPTSQVLRFFFDPCSGVCLWRTSTDPTKCEDYAVDHETLPIGRNTKAAITALIALVDMSIDLENAPDTGPYWSEGAEKLLEELKQSVFATMRTELISHGYQVVRE